MTQMASEVDPRPPLVALGAGDLPDEAFKMIVDMTAYPFVVINPDGYIRYAGGSIERVLGWPADQVAGKNMVELTRRRLEERPPAMEPARKTAARDSGIRQTYDGVPMRGLLGR